MSEVQEDQKSEPQERTKTITQEDEHYLAEYSERILQAASTLDLVSERLFETRGDRSQERQITALLARCLRQQAEEFFERDWNVFS